MMAYTCAGSLERFNLSELWISPENAPEDAGIIVTVKSVSDATSQTLD